MVPATNAVASRQVQLSDSFKVNDRLALGPNVSYAGTTGAGESFLGGFSANWRPQSADTYNASVALGSSQPAAGLIRTFSDPNSARVNCAAGTAQVSGPGDLPSKQSAASYDLSWTHQWAHGQFSIDTYRQTQANQLVYASLTADSLGITDPANPFYGYYNAVGGYFGDVCPGAGTPSVYVSEPIGGTTRLYQGFTAQANIGIGKNIVVIPSYTTSGADILAADPRFLGFDSTLILGSQLPGRPVHTGNLTVDALYAPAKLELLANAHYVGREQQPVHRAVRAGQPGRLASAGDRAHHGLRVEPVQHRVRAVLDRALRAADPAQRRRRAAAGRAPERAARVYRHLLVQHRRAAGRRLRAPVAQRASRRSRRARPRSSSAPGWASVSSSSSRRRRGRIRSRVATVRPECTVALQPAAQRVLAALKGAADAYAAGQPVPGGRRPDDHAARRPQGRLVVRPGAEDPRRRAARAAAERRERRSAAARRAARRGGPGGPGGPPPGFQPEVTVAPNPNESPRPQFSPSPELIAALEPLRALSACAYGTLYTPAEAKAKGFDVAAAAQAVPAASPSPGASAAPAAGPSPSPSRVAATGRCAAGGIPQRSQLRSEHRYLRGARARPGYGRWERETVAWRPLGSS